MKFSLTTYATIGIVAFVIATMVPSTQATSNDDRLLGKCTTDHTDLLMDELAKVFGSDDNTDNPNAQQDRELRSRVNDIPPEFQSKKYQIKWNWIGEDGKMMFWMKDHNPRCYQLCYMNQLLASQCVVKFSQCKMPQYWGVNTPSFEIVWFRRHLRQKGSPKVPELVSGNIQGQRAVMDAAPNMMCKTVQETVHAKLLELLEKGNSDSDTDLQDCAMGLLQSQPLDCDIE
jgi:hypothetical protein